MRAGRDRCGVALRSVVAARKRCAPVQVALTLDRLGSRRYPRGVRTLASSLVVVATVASLGHQAGTATAEPRRPGLTAGVALGVDLASVDGGRGAGLGFGAHLGWLLADHARLGFEAELLGAQTWSEGRRRVDGVLLAGLRLWPHDRISATVGLGVAAGDDRGTESFVGAGAAAGATLGLDVHRWQRTALALRAVGFGGRFEDATALHLGLSLAVEWYGLTTPPR